MFVVFVVIVFNMGDTRESLHTEGNYPVEERRVMR